MVAACLACAGAHAAPGPGSSCVGDINTDGLINFADITAILAVFGQLVPDGSPLDPTGDGVVNFDDLIVVLSTMNQACGPDARVVAVLSPETAVSGMPVLIEVGVEHQAVEPIDVPVRVQIGSSIAEAVVPEVAPDRTTFATLIVHPPATPADCGIAERLTVEACTTVPLDARPGNDCRTEAIDVTEAYWDLRLGIQEAPQTATPGSSIRYLVTVKNAGTIPATRQCVMTNIATSATCSNNQGSFDIIVFTTPIIDPGRVFTFTLTVYTIPSTAAPGPRFIRATLGPGCSDPCWAENCASVPISIVAP